MNKSYRLIWNEFTNTWVAVSEIAKSRGKRASGVVLLAAAGIVLAPAQLYAAPPNPPAATQLPTGGQVVAGQAAIAQNGTTLTVTQTTNRAAVDWQTFNIGSQAHVNFVQPGANAAILNRVMDPNPSQIFGRITANGQVFLTNASGIYFGASASANVGALTATTHSISNDDFMAGRLNFTRNGAIGKVENEGNLTADLGGYIALLAPEVRNSGVIIAQGGTVALAAGEAFELQFDGNRLANIRVEPATIAALVENGNAVHAPGGLIILSAQAADRLQGGVVKNTGSLEATGLVNDGGTIRLLASDRIEHTGSINVNAAPGKVGAGGTAIVIADLSNPDSHTTVSGSISARGGDLGGVGGFIETSAATLDIADSVRIDTQAPMGKTGQWLLDPVDITVASSGGNVTGSAIATALQSTNVTLDTADPGTCTGVTCSSLSGITGNITINDNITVSGGSANTTLTFKAANNIVQNASKTISRSGDYKLNISLISDSDSNKLGGILIYGNLDSNGGDILMGGGANGSSGAGYDTLTTLAVRVGPNDVGSSTNSINANGGNITIKGMGDINSTTTYLSGWGVDINAPLTTTGTGSITIEGAAGNYSPYIPGIHGVIIQKAISTESGAINITGTGGTQASNPNDGIKIASTGSITTTSGNITLTGTKGGGTGVGIKTEGAINGGSGNVSLVANTMTIGANISGTGTLTIKPKDANTTIGIAGGAGTLALTAANFSTNFANGFSGITIGSSTAGAINVGGAVTYNDALTLKSASNITLKSGAALTGTNGENASLALWADGDGHSDGQSFGFISLGEKDVSPGATIETNGGHLWMGGGMMSSTSWNGLTVGNGAAWGDSTHGNGINLFSTSSVSTGAGNISLNGSTSRWSNEFSMGIEIGFGGGAQSRITTTSGNIEIVGTNYNTNGNDWGALVHYGAIVASTDGGNISIRGSSSQSDGAVINGAVLANSGNISISGTKGSSGSDVNIQGTVGFKDGSSVTTSSSNISVTADTLSVSGAMQSSGVLSIKPKTAGRTIGIAGGTGDLPLPASYFSSNFANGFSGITIGDATSGAITIGGDTTLNDFTTFITGGNIAVNAALNASGQTLTLTGGSGATVSGSGNITATNLLLNGSGATYSLNTASGNNVGTLAASTGSGNVSFYNNAALTVGSVGSTNGITTSGTVDVETLSGNLTVSQNITTTNTSASAVVLNAGRSTAELTASGGNILLSGSPTISTGTGGIAKLYTGSVSGSTGLSSYLVSGSGRFRYASDEATPNFSTALLAGNNAIYRESIAVTVMPDAYTSPYGATVAPTAFTVSSGSLQNGDSLGTISATISSIGTSTSNAGSYDLSASGMPARDSLGYALTGANNTGGHTISKAHLTVAADNKTRLYGEANPIFSTTLSGFVNGEVLSTSGVTGSGSGTTTATTGTGVGTATITATAGTLAASNYDFTTLSNGTLTIGKANLRVTADNASKLFGETKTFAGTEFSSLGLQNGESIGSVSLSSAGAPATASVLGSPYAILASNAIGGTFSSSNYTLTYSDGALTVGAAPVQPPAPALPTVNVFLVPPPPVILAPPMPLPLMAPPPLALTQPTTVATASLARERGIVVALAKMPAAQSDGVVTVTIPKETALAGQRFSFELPGELRQQTASGSPASAELPNGLPLPAWLRFEPELMRFIASALPEGAFPLTLVVSIGGVRSTIQISEQQD